MVRLINKKTGKIVETQVTGSKGRYSFLAPPGEYMIQVQKPTYTFPTEIKKDVKLDEPYSSLYHGETITVKDQEKDGVKTTTYIAKDIPLDPEAGTVAIYGKPLALKGASLTSYLSMDKKELEKENLAIFKKEKLRKISYFVAYLGPILGIISFILQPGYFTGTLLVLHALIFFLFYRLVRQKTAPPWGKVYNVSNKEALPGSIIRLFDDNYGRLLLTAMSKSDGKYGFLVGDEKYVLTAEKEGYAFPEKRIMVIPERKGVVKKNLGMKEIRDNRNN